MEPSRWYSSSHCAVFGKGYSLLSLWDGGKVTKETEKRPDASKYAEPASSFRRDGNSLLRIFESAGEYSTLLSAAPALAHVRSYLGFPS